MEVLDPPIADEIIRPIEAKERVFVWRDHAALWFSLGVGLLVVQTGALLVPATGARNALLAVVLGSAIGAGLLAWVARLACASGLSSAALMHVTFGRRFARLPIFLNIIQLIGWTVFEIVIMRDGTLTIYGHSFSSAARAPVTILIATLLWGGILLMLLSGSMVKLVRRVVSHFALPLVVLSLIWLTWQFSTHLAGTNVAAFWRKTGDGSMGFLSAMDLVIAMPVSWLPLVSDYARHGQLENSGARKAFQGTFLGYFLANIWCYGLGTLVITGTAASANLLNTLLLAQGGLIALGFILLDELDNAYGDVYSCSVSAHSIWPRWSIRRWGQMLAVGCIILALIVSITSLEPFLLMLSSVFVPLFGVILGRLGTATFENEVPQTPPVNKSAALIWILGIVLFHALGHWLPHWGSTLPTLLLTFLASKFIISDA